KAPERPKIDPVQSHHARNISLQAGQVQGESFVQLGHRQAYHDLIDPQGGFEPAHNCCFWMGLCNIVTVSSSWNIWIYLLSIPITRSIRLIRHYPGVLIWAGNRRHWMRMASLVKMNSMASLA